MRRNCTRLHHFIKHVSQTLLWNLQGNHFHTYLSTRGLSEHIMLKSSFCSSLKWKQMNKSGVCSWGLHSLKVNKSITAMNKSWNALYRSETVTVDFHVLYKKCKHLKHKLFHSSLKDPHNQWCFGNTVDEHHREIFANWLHLIKSERGKGTCLRFSNDGLLLKLLFSYSF